MNAMKYIFTLETQADNRMLIENPEEAKKAIGALVEQIKPEVMYFSTIRRCSYIVVNVENACDDRHSLERN
jgi:hypothetical protein